MYKILNVSAVITKSTHAQVIISQKIDGSLIDGFKLYLKCVAKVDLTYFVDMRWNSKHWMPTVWMQQSPIIKWKYHNSVERTLLFNPWLDSQAGEYTCHVTVKVNDSFSYMVNKTKVVSGKYM